MPNLGDLFSHMLSDASYYMRSNSGKEFEERIRVKIDGLGYTRILPSDVGGDFKQIKADVLERVKADHLNNETNYKNHFIYQPFGSQNYPDFLVFDQARLISIEVKYSNQGQTSPVWNSGLPRPNGIYIFGSWNRKQITYFLGCDVLSSNDARKLHEFFSNMKQQEDEFNAREMTGHPYGFAVYNRKAFEQKKKYSDEAITNFFDNPHRQDLERKVISDVKGGES